ncbi:MAG TPA: A/G-specific adenine glycosylase [Spirochaetota bacterium]|nr:A/G-specific adenine glycosylase [Spirochaetota bacterium]
MAYPDESAIDSFRLREDVASYSGSLSGTTIEHFRTIILDHYRSHRRDFPWRRTADPYHILVSEVMLQQTQADRVADKFEAFILRFPTMESLAAAELSDVLSAWQGLGYNRRGMMLHRLARMVMDEYGGSVPDTEDDLVRLPGIGRATAAAICVYAFNRPLVYIETNIRAVFIHFFFHDQSDVPDGLIRPLVEATLDPVSPYHWYSALMDYGAMLKKSRANPGRKSAHYQKQSRFEGSRRQARGMALKLLLEKPGLTADQIALALEIDPGYIEVILDDMAAEGIIRKEGEVYRI